ncbi:MAG: hypothetical protein N3B16_06330 [Candidatus Aminicenantes bacterium]|nr:hypothetical protein [Candidatus Aminicenantes bacterium]
MRQRVFLALLILLAVGLLVLPVILASQTHADYCFNEWERCRERALASDAGWFKTTLMLTVCDIALLKCLYMVV